MKITIESIRSRLKMIPDIETAAILCDFKTDGITIRQDKNISIIFSISNFFPLTKREEEEKDIKYENLIKTWKQAIFGNNNKVEITLVNMHINHSLGRIQKINLLHEPNIIITKEDLAHRFTYIGGIKEAWIICEVGEEESYINYRYDMGIYIKLDRATNEDEKRREIRRMLYVLFDGYENLHRLGFLHEDEKEVDYKGLKLKLGDMTKIL